MEQRTEQSRGKSHQSSLCGQLDTAQIDHRGNKLQQRRGQAGRTRLFEGRRLVGKSFMQQALTSGLAGVEWRASEDGREGM